MKWSIHQLSKYRQTGMPIDAEVQLDDVMNRNSDIRHISPVTIKGLCTFGASQMTCQLKLTATLTLIKIQVVLMMTWIFIVVSQSKSRLSNKSKANCNIP